MYVDVPTIWFFDLRGDVYHASQDEVVGEPYFIQNLLHLRTLCVLGLLLESKS